MSNEGLIYGLDSDSSKQKKRGKGRPKGTTRAQPIDTAQNVPFTEFENKKLEELIEKRGQNKRYWLKKFIWEGLIKELESCK